MNYSRLSHLLSNLCKYPQICLNCPSRGTPDANSRTPIPPISILICCPYWVYDSKARVLILLYSNPNQMEDRQPEVILARRYNDVTKQHEYQVHWINYRLSEATWETRHRLRDHMQMVEEFDAMEDGADQLPLRKPIRKKCTKRTASLPKQPVPPLTPPVQRRGRGRPPKNALKHGGPQSPISLDASTPHREKPEEAQPVEPQHQSSPQPSPPKRKRGRPRKIQPSEPLEEKEEEKERKRSKPRGNSKLEKINHKCHEVFENQFSHQDEESAFFVLDVRRGKEGLVFVVSDHRKKKLITRSQLVNKHPMALLAFYEARIKFKELPGGEDIEGSLEEALGADDYGQEEDGSSIEELGRPRRRYPFRRRK